MEDLRQTALAYYYKAGTDNQSVVNEFFGQMDRKGNGYVKFEEFSAYMETIGRPDMSSQKFYDDLKQCGNNELFIDDIITLFYIIKSNRPFCGKCGKFVKGMYFTCLKCFRFGLNEINESGIDYTTFSVCSQCYAAGDQFHHPHKEFLDTNVLLNIMRMEFFGNKHTNSHSHDDKQETTTNYSLSKSIVPAVNQQSKQVKLQTAIQFGQLAASIGSMAIASQLCTIL